MRFPAANTALWLAAVLVSAVITTQSAQAQTFTALNSFNMTDGFGPVAPLVQGTDGNLYGTTFGGGANDSTSCPSAQCGTVFQITTTGTLNSIYSFCSKDSCTDGSEPYAPLIQGTDGNFYGTTLQGGNGSYCFFTGNCGTVFKITTDGTLTTLYNFCSKTACADGGIPEAGLILGTDGNFYGTTYSGGAGSACPYSISGCGTAFKITPSGTLTTLYNFCSQTNCADGDSPVAPLIQGSDGNFYGTELSGGADLSLCGGYGCGTVFKLTSKGVLTTLYSFCSQTDCADGAGPYAGLIQATDGNFYGTTIEGGSATYGSLCSEFGFQGCGTVFQITPSGTLTTLYSFCVQDHCADGAGPGAALIQATDGNLYGTTESGGAYGGIDPCNSLGCGTIFEITTAGAQTRLYSFAGIDGQVPEAPLIQVTDGNFYGTTYEGGAYADCTSSPMTCGAVFSLSNFLNPFVKTEPTSGPVRSAVSILGTNLAGATSVTFNGTAATFKVVSPSLITTTVPSASVTSGFVKVVTPPSSSGTLTSNVPFTITSAITSTSLVSSGNPIIYGEPVTFTATVSSPSGTPPGKVTFMNGAAKLGTVTLQAGVASFTTTTLGAGKKSITAVYGGAKLWGGSTSPILAQTVDKAKSLVTLKSSENPSTVGESVTFTATVAPEFTGTPTGKVTFLSGTATLGTVPLTDGVAAFTTSSLASGVQKITAKYAGSTNFTSGSADLTQTVNQDSP